MSQFPTAKIPTICAWCPSAVYTPHDVPLSHGICDLCLARLTGPARTNVAENESVEYRAYLDGRIMDPRD